MRQFLAKGSTESDSRKGIVKQESESEEVLWTMYTHPGSHTKERNEEEVLTRWTEE
jgi:hypothetical protein